jgi:hypothetical protein
MARSPINYRGKHKKPEGYAGSTPRGPHRWLRAADNAMARPNSQAGRLFWSRTSNAHRMAEAYPLVKGPFGHQQVRRSYNYNEVVSREIPYYTCSLFCCAMVVQLDHAVHSFEDLELYLSEDQDSPVKARPARGARCYFCASKIAARN